MASSVFFGNANNGFQAGTIYGPVNTTFHLPPERPETPPPPSILIPFVRDADFVERGTTLGQLQQRCAAPDARAALVGLGGVGKSQLAIEHAYRTHKESPDTWVFWVHASNADRFRESYRSIADRVKIAGRQDPQANIFKLVHDWLCDCKQRWLLVLDNVDDAHFLLSGQAGGDGQGQTTNAQVIRKPLREYLPHCERGSIIVTTRHEAAALKLVERRDIVRVKPMDEAEGLALFKKKLGLQGNNSGVAELAAVLEYMPLAIVQAAAYILQRAPQYSVAKYLDEYRKSERKRTSLLNYDEGHLRRDWEAKNSIIVTWQISFEYIQQTRSSAADLLSLMSFFDRQGIPEDLLRPRTERQEAETNQTEKAEDDGDSNSEDDVSQSSAGDDEFGDDVVVLQSFCFISTDAGGTMFEMHALVQLATRKWLESTSKLEQWKQKFVSNLCAAFPTGEYENSAACQALYAHAKAAREQQPKDESSIAEWATVLYRAAWFAERSGNIADAETLAIKAMKARKKVLGQGHEDTLWSVAMVGLAYRLGGRWDDAEELFVQVIETSKKKLGADHPDTLTIMANLALTYQNQGRWDAAEELEVQVIETSKKKLGADHPHTLTGIGNLASTYQSQGRWKEAEELEVQVMEMRKKKLGADHPSTLTSMANLASTYRNQGRWDAAEELFVQLEVQVMETRKKKLGADHPHTLTSMNNLALTCINQGRWDYAEKLQVQVMEARKKKLGADHPDTLTSMANLAFTWKAQARSAEAIVLMRQCVQQRQQVLKAGHPDLTLSLRVLERWEVE
ncbi:TPR-like protein [Setomelanomma holmii]|uniref:TPR-like protein n=1 Tax=Setomelanomma holmii TaxID=210430 RepID=A0A9P4HD56_9PLEO|nr:TPR-like protein [Setomelanomma holmii]